MNDSSKKRVRFKSSLKNVTHIHEQDETESKNDKNKTQLMKHKDLMNELYNENDETGNNDNNNKEDINKSNQDLSENQDEKQIKEKSEVKVFI